MESKVWTFSREQVEACDFSEFLSVWGKENLPAGRPLQRLLNSLDLKIVGFNTAELPYEVPEIRRFFRRLRETWPFELFFLDLRQPALRVMSISCQDNVSLVARDDSDVVAVDYGVGNLSEFVRQGFRSMNWLFDRAGLGQEEQTRRSIEVVAYFNGIGARG